MGIRSDLQAELRSLLSNDIVKGKLTVQRAYADWRRYPQYVLPLTESSIDLIWAPAYGSAKKNATDIRLAIDALELVFTRPEIGTFILLSGDSDFSTLVIKLKEYGKYVIGVGIRESSSDLLVMNCDEYYSYNALAGLVRSGEDETTRWDPWQLVTEALSRMKRNGDVMRSDRLKQVMQEIDSSFDEKDLGMPKFSRFVQEAAHKGLVKASKLESGQLEVDVPDSSTVAAATPTSSSAVSESAEPRRERASDRDRNNRRGRRGRGRERETGEHRAVAELPPAAAISDDVAVATSVERSVAGSDVVASDVAAPVAASPTVAPRESALPSRPIREERGGRSRVADTSPVFSFGASLFVSIGVSGERLTRNDAFDLVKRSVESLVSGNDAVRASSVRRRAFELLGRDSESLSERGFERILMDAHDADMIDLRRRGNDFEVARAVEEAPIVEQLKEAEEEQKAAEAANAPPPSSAPRGMAPRGISGKSSSAGRARGGATPPADLLMVGVVGKPKAAASSEVKEAATATTTGSVKAATVEAVTAESGETASKPRRGKSAAGSASGATAGVAAAKGAKKSAASIKSTANKSTAKAKSSAADAAKNASKPAKTAPAAAKKVAKAAKSAPTAKKSVAKAAKSSATKAAKTPAKRASKTAAAV